MRTSLTPLFLTFAVTVCNGAENPRPSGKNCALVEPPATAGEESNHDAILRIHPRAKDIDGQYTGCQALFVEYRGAWTVVSITEVVQGDPIRIWSEHKTDTRAMSCRYAKGKVVRGDPNSCPAAEYILMRSMAPGCVQVIRDAVAKSGLGAPRPGGCEYE